MPTAITKPTEVGFAEFTAQLISETFQAVISSMVQQEKEVRDTERLTALGLEDFAKLSISEDTLRAEIIRLFPSKEGKDTESSIDPGSIYTPPTDKQAEDPPIFLLTGYQVAKEDVKKDGETGKLRITEDGYGHIKEKVRLTLAANYKEIIATILQKGMPRVLVDHGRINTKLSFYLTEGKEEAKPKLPLAFISKSALPRLTVRPVSNRTPEFLTLTVNVIGEVEITFKTISV
jgi:hypothetical protein